MNASRWWGPTFSATIRSRLEQEGAQVFLHIQIRQEGVWLTLRRVLHPATAPPGVELDKVAAGLMQNAGPSRWLPEEVGDA